LNTVRPGIASAALIGFAILAPAANAATIRVTTTKDEFGAGGTAKCALREAVQAANTNAKFGGCPRGNGPDRIRLRGRTYRLAIEVDASVEDANTEGDIDVNGNTTITGRGSGKTEIDGNAQKLDERILDQVGGNLKLVGITLRNGQESDGSGNGGAVANEAGGALSVLRSRVVGNFADHAGGGLATKAGGTITITRSLIAENSASSHGGGVSAFPDGGAETIRNSSIVANFGDQGPGGVISGAGKLTVISSRVTDNSGTQDGGGIDIHGNGALIQNSTISGNRQTATGSVGGGIYDESNTGAVRILGSTISRNFSTTGGGGIYAANGPWRIRNSTISGNEADDLTEGAGLGAGIFNDGAAMALESVTVYGNRAIEAVGVYNHAGTLSLRNSIIAGNREIGPIYSTVDCDVLAGTAISLGHNLIGDGSCDPLGSDLFGDSHNPLFPRLGPLANNGGPTATLELLPGSPAINHGQGCSRRDQRGFKRKGKCDIGAFERQ
jgi:CSLREA domain-containing protein